MDVTTDRQAEQQRAAAARAAGRTGERQARIALLRKPGGIAEADEPRRVAARIDRLGGYHPDVRPVSAAAIAAGDPAALTAAGAILERIAGTNDLLGVGYLEGGVTASAAVGRVTIRNARGRLIGYGTGSLVSPELLLTNHHVLPDAETAGFSLIEFDYQDGTDGLPRPVRAFPLDPGRFFAADRSLDFALVAVKATADELRPFGFTRLIASEGKAIVGDFVTIVQHPGGGKKQLALRENRVVDVLDEYLHYETDTEPGSSGSPVFNDQWEVVALHHASVPAPGHAEYGGVLNEGVRVGKVLKFLREQQFTPTQRALLDGPVIGRIDPDYSNREGYDPAFLPGHTVPLPGLSDALVPLAAVNRQATGEPRYVLPYHHFSVVMHRERRLAMFTAVNIDGRTSRALRREADHWSLDPRLAVTEQVGEELYRANPLDRGHLVRRLDPAWGATEPIAQLGNDDTFHFTNCSPQHKDFNQNKTTWAGLEDYVLHNADTFDLKVSVVTGPVLAADDDRYRDVQLPRQFWKVVAIVKTDGSLSATAYLLSQEELLHGLEVATEFDYGAYRTYQVPVRRIAELTGLSFGDLEAADPLAGLESTGQIQEIRAAADLVL